MSSSPPPSTSTRVREGTDQSKGPLQVQAVGQWWDEDVHESMQSKASSMPLSLEQSIWLALNNSAQIQVFSDLPLIREQAIVEADAYFDWNTFFDTRWDDLNNPVGNSLTVGGTATRYLNNQFSFAGGLRRKNEVGGKFEIAQQFGTQATNSTYFLPPNQGTARLALSYTQPLLRGRGEEYNRSLYVLANIDTQAAQQEFYRQLQAQLVEVTRSYWGIYLERASLIQKFRLYEASAKILKDLEARSEIDTNQSVIVRAKAAVVGRRADLVRARTAVKNAEARLRGLVNAMELGDGQTSELIPMDTPWRQEMAVDVSTNMANALQVRPEINQAMKEMQAACVRLNMSKNEMLPTLNLIAETYVAGLRGSFDVGQAYVDQFSVGAPSYSIGLQYEVPIGRRQSQARLTRREIELRQIRNQFRSVTETIKVEVEVATREVETAFKEMLAKQQQIVAATRDTQSIATRWEMLPGADGSANVVLDQLLQAQERQTAAEHEFLLAELTYNLALTNLKKSTGELLRAENITEGRTFECGVPRTILDKAFIGPAMSSETSGESVAPDPGVID
ncbi:MAG: TolC family protein [Planctomycetaceae bacterium]